MLELQVFYGFQAYTMILSNIYVYTDISKQIILHLFKCIYLCKYFANKYAEANTFHVTYERLLYAKVHIHLLFFHI